MSFPFFGGHMPPLPIIPGLNDPSQPGDSTSDGGICHCSPGTETFTYSQTTPNSYWRVKHNLGTRRPLVFVYYSDGDPVNVAWYVEDKDTVIITPSVPFVGTVVIYKVNTGDSEPTELDPPAIEGTQDEGELVIHYTLPEGSVAVIIQYDTSEEFADPKALEGYGAGLVAPQLEGTYYFRAQSQGMTNETSDSEWSEPIMFELTEPTDVSYVDTSPMSFITGTPDIRPNEFCSKLGTYNEVHYNVLNSQGAFDVDEQTVDVPSESLPTGEYTLRYYIELDDGRTISTVRALNVAPIRLATPVVVVVSTTAQSVTLGGLVSNAAAGWRLKMDGSNYSEIIPTDDGYYTVTGLANANGHLFSVQAVGDGVTYSDSLWSDAVKTADTRVYHVLTDYFAADRCKRRQNFVFCAQIMDVDAREVLDPMCVSEIKMSVYRQNPFGGRTEVSGFINVPVPLASLSGELKRSVYWRRDPLGCNFSFVPDQTGGFICDERGVYEVEITFAVKGDNPIVARWQLNVL